MPGKIDMNGFAYNQVITENVTINSHLYILMCTGLPLQQAAYVLIDSTVSMFKYLGASVFTVQTLLYNLVNLTCRRMLNPFQRASWLQFSFN